MQPISVEGTYHKAGLGMIGPVQPSASSNFFFITTIDYMTTGSDDILIA